jgi:ketosteroid isomerase-like protein
VRVSQENVEVVRAALEAFNRRDGAAFDALLASDAEIFPVRAAVERMSYQGADAGSQYCAAVDERWENARWEVEDIRDDCNWVLALGHIRGRGRDSGAAFDARAGWVAHLDEGLITRFQTFSDRSAALKAVGLEE